MQIKKATAFESVRDNGYRGWIAGGELAEAKNGEEEVLVGVSGLSFGGDVTGGNGVGEEGVGESEVLEGLTRHLGVSMDMRWWS